MQIETAIMLRKDGTVKVTSPTGVDYIFKPNDGGQVVCDVADEGDIAWLLRSDDFFPANEEDYDTAYAITSAQPVEESDHSDMNAAPIEESHIPGDEGVDPGDDDVVDENSPPVETSVEMLLGSTMLPPEITISDDITVSLSQVVSTAHSESGLTIKEWNALPDDEREAMLVKTINSMTENATAFKVGEKAAEDTQEKSSSRATAKKAGTTKKAA